MSADGDETTLERFVSARPRLPRAPSGASVEPDLERAFTEHRERIRRFLERLGHRRADAEDLSSEVFLIAHEKMARFDPSRAFLPWLFGIAANVSRRHQQRGWVRRWIAVVLAREPDLTDRAIDPEQRLLDREDAQRVHAALDAMAKKKRLLLVLRECEELSAQEIGAALEMPESSVYPALHYARKEFLRRYRQILFLEGSR